MTTLGWGFETAVRTLWQEARSEVLRGQQATAHAMVNRLRSGKWGDTWGEVTLGHAWQFSGWNPADPGRIAACALADDDPLLGELRHVLASAEVDDDFTGGAEYYYAPGAMKPQGAKPRWVLKARYVGEGKWLPATFCGQWGRQLFFKDIA